MKLLVTGAAGFIGSTYVRIAGQEHDIVVLDKLTYAGRPENLQWKDDRGRRVTDSRRAGVDSPSRRRKWFK